MTRTSIPLPAACPEFVLPPPAPWELRDIFITPKQKSLSSGWNSRMSCWSCLLPWGLVLDMSLGHFSILSWLLAAAVWAEGTRTGMVTAGWGSAAALTPAQVAKCCCNTNKELVLGSCLKLMGWRGTEGLSKGFGESLGKPLPILDPSFSICKSWGGDADFMWKRSGTSLKAKC